MGEEINIPPDQNGQPVPGIPATEGWQLMERKLDQALPVQSMPAPSTGWEIVIYILIVAGILLAGSFVIYITDHINDMSYHKDRISKISASAPGNNAVKNVYAQPGNKDVYSGKKDTSVLKTGSYLLHKKNELLSNKDQASLLKSVNEPIKKYNPNRLTGNDERAQFAGTKNTDSTSGIERMDSSIVNEAVTYSKKVSEDIIATEKLNYSGSHIADTLLNDRTKITGTKSKKVTGKIWQGGIQLSAPVPINGTGYYFSGTSGRNQYYRVLFPSLWMTYSTGNNNLSAFFAPFTENSFPALPFKRLYRGAAPNPLSDTSLTLLKVFGINISASYTRNIGKHLKAGIGIGLSSWSKGLIRWQRSLPNSSGVPYAIKKDTLYGISRSDSLWKYVNGSQVSIEVELIYDLRSLQVGMKAGIPIKRPVNADNTGYPVQSSLFFRYKLFGKQMK